ncbi:hypothetical protein CFC21_096238 [Triticum aestivum]|uniref:Uncharacterized protein n=2 Tax=Triticum aestivum TaxID=4565 RepID=A0A3B6RDU4_WHEAT|nr:hypothetical protein CFC21_096238 [Triticum aestivum]
MRVFFWGNAANRREIVVVARLQCFPCPRPAEIRVVVCRAATVCERSCDPQPSEQRCVVLSAWACTATNCLRQRWGAVNRGQLCCKRQTAGGAAKPHAGVANRVTGSHDSAARAKGRVRAMTRHGGRWKVGDTRSHDTAR